MRGGSLDLDEMLNLRSARLKQTTIQQSCTMNDSQDDYRLAGDTEDSPVLTIDEMAVGCAENPVFGNQWAALGESFQSFNLFRQFPNEQPGVSGVILGDIVPYFRNVQLCGVGYVNLECCGHF